MEQVMDLLKSRDLWKIAVASAIGGLFVVWLAPVARKIPPK